MPSLGCCVRCLIPSGSRGDRCGGLRVTIDRIDDRRCGGVPKGTRIEGTATGSRSDGHAEVGYGRFDQLKRWLQMRRHIRGHRGLFGGQALSGFGDEGGRGLNSVQGCEIGGSDSRKLAD